MASRAVSLSADLGSMTPSRMLFLRSSAPAPLRRPPLPKQRLGSGGTTCTTRLCAISKQRAMQPIAPSGNTTPPTRPTASWLVNWKHVGTRRLRALRKLKARSLPMMRKRPYLQSIRHRLPCSQPISRAVWTAPTTDARLKKRIVRTLIHEVVADIDEKAAEIVLLVHWVGGVHSEIRLPKRRRGQRNSTSADVIAAVRQLVLIAEDDLIAGILNRNGLTTGHGNRWTRERVTSLRSHHRIAVYKPDGRRDRTLAQSQRRRKITSSRAQDAQVGGGSR